MDAAGLSPSITLAIDALSPNLTGIGRYCWELCTRLPGQEELDRVHFYRDGTMPSDPAVFLRARLPWVTRLRRHRWARKLQRSSLQRRMRDSLFHSPNFFLPPMAEDGIITVHDLSVFRYPETHPPERVRQFERQFERTLRKASHILTDSDTMRQEIIAYTGFPTDRVTTTYMGVSDRYRPYAAEDIRSVLAAEGLEPGQYALCVSTLEPRKRLHALLGAWKRLPEGLRRECPLVLIGARGWANEALMRDIAIARREGWLRLLGYVAEDALPFFYAGARLFLYPSIYEGFGLPPIEAMACGVPTIVSDTSCLPEVTRGASMLVSPDDGPAFAEKIEEALTATAWRTSAINQGRRVAQEYSWDACIDRTIDVYRRQWACR
ncbi:MAG: glycosyltransferase family 1 protein [Methylacidiphilaceae bacterium]|nr:glycosyltransferase family 1 protein [Candidatus Methylacidiphilaceae bacterium]